MTRFTLLIAGAAALIAIALSAAMIGAAPAGPEDAEAASDTTPAEARYSDSGYDITPLSDERVAQLAGTLDPEAYRITQKAGTEPAHCGDLLNNKTPGVYICIVCGLPLVSSDHKFTSGTGWPSFDRPLDPAHVTEKEDRSLSMTRTEVTCARCDAHLGHVFSDGPEPTGRRYCLNSAALKFYAEDEQRPPESRPAPREVAYFAGGCFWGVEHYFEMGPGVIEAVSGYMQGQLANPGYRDVVLKDTGHAESVKVVFDPNRISYERLVRAFFDLHDPTQVNRQGPDVGPQYRSGIWYVTDEQKKIARSFMARLESSDRYDRPVATEVEKAGEFYKAEDRHQDYIARTGRRCSHTNPWD